MLMKHIPVFLLVVIVLGFSNHLGAQSQYSCLFYNLENLFYPADDPENEGDDAFTPEGERHWTWYRYRVKLSQVSRILLCADGWDTPDIIGLCELENRQVLLDLCNHPLLAGLELEILHRDSPDHRGIDVGVLYRKDRVRCLDTAWIQIRDENGRKIQTREIIAATFLVESDTLLFAMNHWSSKFGGELESESGRMQQAETLGRYLDSIRLIHPGYHLVAGGDLNDNSASKPVKMLSEAFGLNEIIPDSEIATYKYQGRWESIDHVFTDRQLAGIARAVIPELDVLLCSDEKYTGHKPWRTYSGYAYQGGVSDHLPLLLRFELPVCEDH